MMKRHTAEMEQLGDPDDDSRQNTLSQRNIKTLKRREVRDQQKSELLALKNTTRYTSMTDYEQKETIKRFRRGQNGERQ